MTAIPHRPFDPTGPSTGPRMFQIGYVVEDLFAAAAEWARVYEVGPFHIMPRVRADCAYRGGAGTLDIRIGIAQAGPVQIELIQPYSSGPSVFRDLRERYGRPESGVHHLATLTARYDDTKARYDGFGYELACEIDTARQRVAFYDTVADFGYFTEVVEEKPSFLANLEKIATTCANWDGSDPIRILTREGYTTPPEGGE
ncbi:MULTISPECIES: VOC family protein [Nocardia]|uniref:VOC family protein n=1 Tax=Nocardia TaxID=1817 RepID=UPI000D697C27|nr:MULTISPECIES: VOC family protein [Nocardia]